MAAAIEAFYLGGRKPGEPSLDEPASGALLGELERPAVRLARRGVAPEPAAQVGAGGMRRLVVGELAAGEERVDECETRRRAVAHGDRGGPVQLDHGRRLDLEQQVVGR